MILATRSQSKVALPARLKRHYSCAAGSVATGARQRTFASAWRLKIAAWVFANCPVDAQQAVRRYLALRPWAALGSLMRAYPFRPQEVRDRFEAALRSRLCRHGPGAATPWLEARLHNDPNQRVVLADAGGKPALVVRTPAFRQRGYVLPAGKAIGRR
jgi:hypothetical protein